MNKKTATKKRTTRHQVAPVVRRRRSLSEMMARDFFKVGDDPGHPCTRIEFRSSDADGKETAHGGLCESALANLLQRLIDQYLEVVG